MKTFKFISLNLWFGGILFDNLSAFLRQEQPDILALQEVYAGGTETGEPRFRSVEALSQLLGLPHTAFAPANETTIGGARREMGNAILSHWPIRERETVFFDIPYGMVSLEEADRRCSTPGQEFSRLAYGSDGRGTPGDLFPRNLQHVTIACPGGEVEVFNTQGIWGTDGKDNERRLAMGRTIAEQVRGKRTVILSGDFNADINTETVRIIERELTNVFKNKLTSTFNMPRKDTPALAKAVVDMIFVGSGITVERAECPAVDVSDHLPQIVTFGILG